MKVVELSVKHPTSDYEQTRVPIEGSLSTRPWCPECGWPLSGEVTQEAIAGIMGTKTTCEHCQTIIVLTDGMYGIV